MKKLLTLAALFCCMQAFGQSPLHKALAKLAEDKNIEMVTLTKAEIQNAFANAVEGNDFALIRIGNSNFYRFQPYSNNHSQFTREAFEYVNAFTVCVIKGDCPQKEKEKLIKQIKDLQKKAKGYAMKQAVPYGNRYVMHNEDKGKIKNILNVAVSDERDFLKLDFNIVCFFDCDFPVDYFPQMTERKYRDYPSPMKEFIMQRAPVLMP